MQTAVTTTITSAV